MSGPWNTPPAGSDLPPRNGSVARYETRAIYPRNTVTGADWKVGRELVFQFDSDPASGWLVPSETKLYCKFRVKTAAGDAIPSHALRFAASPLYGMLDGARYSMNGTTIQSVQGDGVETNAHLQLRLSGSREAHDTNAMLGCDSLRQKMVHPEVAYAESTQKAGVEGLVETFDPQIIPNDKHKLLSDRVAVNSDVEMASPVSLALSCFGTN